MQRHPVDAPAPFLKDWAFRCNSFLCFVNSRMWTTNLSRAAIEFQWRLNDSIFEMRIPNLQSHRSSDFDDITQTSLFLDGRSLLWLSFFRVSLTFCLMSRSLFWLQKQVKLASLENCPQFGQVTSNVCIFARRRSRCTHFNCPRKSQSPLSAFRPLNMSYLRTRLAPNCRHRQQYDD
jgi:hypothetical protein